MEKVNVSHLKMITIPVLCLLVFNQFYLGTEINSLKEENKRLETDLNKNRNDFYKSLNIKTGLPETVEFCGFKLDMKKTMVRERIYREIINLRHYNNQVELYKTRAKYFFPMIEFYLKKYQLPEDLKYLAVHESALNTKARSSANAVGLWQFMSYTAKDYKLDITKFIDERKDPLKSTNAACKYLKQLYKQFENWPLAIASYNGGPTRVQSAMLEQGEDNFFNLVLPEETERYLFKIIATSIVLKSEAEDFKYKEYSEHLAPFEIAVENELIPIRKICEYFNVSYREFNFFNPQFIKAYAPAGKYVLLLPDRGINAEFKDKIERKEFEWLAVKTPVIAKP